MKKAMYVVSAMLFILSIYMYINLDHGQDKLQSSSIKVNERERNAKNTKRNPYVIWNGSNEMPPGMDDTKKLKPAGETNKSEPEPGAPAVEREANVTQQPATPGIDVNKGEGITPNIERDSGGDNSADDESVELNPGEGAGSNSVP